jgi:hypothetical protein
MLRKAFKRLRRLDNVTKGNLCIILLCVIIAMALLLAHYLAAILGVSIKHI